MSPGMEGGKGKELPGNSTWKKCLTLRSPCLYIYICICVCIFSLSLSFSNIKSLCAYRVLWLNHRAGPRETAVLPDRGGTGRAPDRHHPEPSPRSPLPPKEHRQPKGQK